MTFHNRKTRQNGRDEMQIDNTPDTIRILIHKNLYPLIFLEGMTILTEIPRQAFFKTVSP
jgi:hypothetical protein